MDFADFANELEVRKRRLEAAKAQKCKRATGKPSRSKLQDEFSPENANLMQVRVPRTIHVRYAFIPFAYPPSTRPLEDLTAIDIDDLRLETHHRGKVLFVKTFGTPFRIQAVQIAIEDAHNNFDRLSLYNADHTLRPDQLLPSSEVFAIKEPYYKATGDGGYTIRIDHPTDLIHLHPAHPLAPPALLPRLVELDREAVQFKVDGNAAYAAKEHVKAIDLYTQGIDLCREDEHKLRCDLLRNRAMCQLRLQRPELAFVDAKASVLPDEPADSAQNARRDELNGKAYYHAGRAAYEMGDFEVAKAMFELMRKFTPDDQDSAKELERTTVRLKEQATGEYDLGKMSKSVTKKHNRLDHASFTGNVEVRDAGKCGRGLFVTKDIKAGDLIMCEKSFCAAYEHEDDVHSILINANTNSILAGAHVTLLSSIVNKLQHSHSAAARFFDLHSGGYEPPCEAKLIDGSVAVDSFHVEAIIESNAFSCPTTRQAAKEETSKSREDALKNGNCGIWLKTSKINHSCVPNAMRSFIGDMLIVRATKDMPAGTEILMQYLPQSNDVTKHREVILRTWGFQCDCDLCAAELSGSYAAKNKRKDLCTEVDKWLKANKQWNESATSTQNLAAARGLMKRLEDAYSGGEFEKVPKSALVDISSWFCGAGAAMDSPPAMIDTGIAALQYSGYGIKVAGNDVEVDYSNCCLRTSAIDAAVYVAQGDWAMGNGVLYGKFSSFAKKLWVTCYGEEHGFVDRYGRPEE